jgi:chromosome segregation ATPase
VSKDHKAQDLEARTWDAASEILKDPVRLRAGLDEMIERERSGEGRCDPAAEARTRTDKLAEVGRKRDGYLDLAADGVMGRDELRAKLAALEETRETAERELDALRRRTERLERLERDRDGLIETYASLVPEAIDALGSEGRHRVYKMMGLKALLGADGALGLSGEVIGFPKNGISSS